MPRRTSHRPANRHARLELITLGETRLIRNGIDTNLPPRFTAILAYLAHARPRKVPRDELCEVFWPYYKIDKARHSVSQAIHVIKNTIGDTEIVGEVPWVALGHSVTWDINSVLVALRSGDIAGATCKIHGEFLFDIDVPHSNGFEDWRSKVNAQVVMQLEAQLPSWIEECALRSAGNLARQTVDLLQSRIGLKVGDLPDAERLEALIIHTSSNKSDGLGNPTPVIGRASELRTINKGLQAASSGLSSVVIVKGDSGFGKTRLCQSIKSLVATSHIVESRCYESDQFRAFGSLRDAFRSIELEPLIVRLDEPWRSTLALLFSENYNSKNPRPEEWPQFVLESLARLVDVIARKRPLFMILDDIQWADPATLDFLSYLARRKVPGVFLFIAVQTSAETSLPFQLRQIASLNHTHTITLSHLERDDLLYFIKHIAETKENHDKAVESIWRQTSGHPFLFAQLAQVIAHKFANDWCLPTILAAGKSLVSSHAYSSISFYSATARDVLAVITVFGKPVRYTLVRRVVGLSALRFLRAYEELIRGRVIDDVDGYLVCRHDYVRQVYYSGLTVTQKRVLHTRAAAALSAAGNGPEDLVRHYLKGRRRKELYIAALRAARGSRSRGSPEEVNYFLATAQRASKSRTKSFALLWRRANYSHDAGRVSEAVPLYRQLLRQNHMPRERSAFIRGRLFDAQCLIGDLSFDRINSIGNKLAKHTFNFETLDVQVQCLRSLIRYNFLRSKPDESTEAEARLVKICERFPGSPPAIRALATLAIMKQRTGSNAEAVKLADEAYHNLGPSNDAKLWCDVLAARVVTKALVGDLAAALQTCQTGIAYANEHHFYRLRNMFLANCGAIATDMALYEVAEESLQQVVRAAEFNEGSADIAHGYFNLASLRWAQADLPRVEEIALKCLNVAQTAGNRFITVSLLALLGLVAVERGRLKDARERRRTIIHETTYVGDDLVPIERFIARMFELEQDRDAAIRRLTSVVKNPPPFTNARCKLELKLELARLLSKTNPVAASELTRDVIVASELFGARRISEDATAQLSRIARAT